MEIAGLASLYLKLGIVGFVLVCFMGAFFYMLYKQMKTLTKIFNVLYDENSNNLSLQSTSDIIEAQCNLSKYSFTETIMHICFDNNIHDPVRQKLIHDNLRTMAKNLQDRDITVLSRLWYKNTSLADYLLSHGDYEKIAEIIYDNLMAKYSSSDLLGVLHNEFYKIINATNKYIEQHTKD